jgi:uncharacterized protein YyaL (SSP411 family)
MAHESFEDEATAALMNALYVNIKVDREERPDLDRIYQMSQQLITGRPGGWPLTVFITPEEHWPIFAGTYFPRSASYGMPSFRDVLQRVADFFREHRSEVDATAHRLLEALEPPRLSADAATPDRAYAAHARQRLGESFDADSGGFGSAPKFPHPTEIDLLLSLFRHDRSARRMADFTLRAMASGGLFDHLGGGFFRYCVDREWRIPHFEKMLYDNAALLGLYSDAFCLTGDELFASTANATADWLMRDMLAPNGGFYSTLDADSEGEEGRYYVFSPDDLVPALDTAEVSAATDYFALDQPANFEGRAWHLQPGSRVVAFGQGPDVLEAARRKLLALREQRERPGRDDKILTSWNGLLLRNLAKAARGLDRPDLGHAAEAVADFVRASLWQDGRLLASHKDGRSRFMAYLDDHAFLVGGLVELLQWRFRTRYLDFAIELADCMLAHFEDPQGGFFFTADDHERLIHRPKPLADEALPSGNGMAALALDTLGHLLGESRYLDAARRTVVGALPSIARHPEAHATLLAAMDRLIEPPEIVVVRGPAASLADWRREIDAGFHPNRQLFLISDDTDELPELLRSRQPLGEFAAYVCRGTQCLAPVTDLTELVDSLGAENLNTTGGDPRSRG